MALSEEAKAAFAEAKTDFFKLKQAADRKEDPSEREYLLGLAEQARNRAKTIQSTGQVVDATDISRAGMAGATLGWGDEIEAGVRAVADAVLPSTEADQIAEGFGGEPQSFGDSYQMFRDDIRGEMGAVSDAYPDQMLGAELAGGFIGPGSIARGVVGGATTLPSLATRLTGLGAAGGGAAGLGYTEAEDPLGMGIDTAKGAAAGAVFSPAITLGIPAVGAVGSRLANFLSKSAPERADELVGQIMRRTGLDANTVQARLEELGPDATLADIDDAFTAYAGAAADKSESALNQTRFYADRNEGAASRLIDEAEEAAQSQAYIYPEARRDTVNRRDEAASPLYEALEGTHVPRNRIKDILATPMGARAYAQALEDYKNRYRISEDADDFTGNMIPLEVLDDMKRNLDQIAGQINRGQNIGSTQIATDMAADLRGRIDALYPDYARARETYSSSSRLLDAGDLGRSVGPKARPEVIEETAEQVAAMSPAENTAYRMGWLQRFMDEVNLSGGAKGTGFAGSRLGTPEQRRNYVELAEDPARRGELEGAIEREERFNTVASYLSPYTGSRTQTRAAAGDLADAQAGLPGAVSQVVPEDLAGLANIFKNVTGMSDEVATEMGRRLMNPNLTLADLERMADTGEIPRSLLRVIKEDPRARALVPAVAAAGGPTVDLLVD